MEIKLLFKYEEPITIGEHKVKAIRQVPRGNETNPRQLNFLPV